VGVIRQRPDLRWQILTKRPERIAEHLPADWGDGLAERLARRHDREPPLRRPRRPAARDPAAVRFISAEPLLGPLIGAGPSFADGGVGWGDGYYGPELDLDGLDWLIVGGESGPRARRMDPRWARDLIQACAWSDVACFVKQTGKVLAAELGLRDRVHGGDAEEWPASLRVREFPELREVAAR
jgi:protein gp37